MSIHGHYWTLWPHVRKVLRPPSPPDSRHFATHAPDPVLGEVPLTGRLSGVPGARTLLLVVHGLGGSGRSKYTFGMAHAAVRAGMSCLRINLRGADRLGRDFYHAGQSEDLGTVLAAPELAAYENVLVVGYSIGGHVVLRYVQGPTDPRVRAAAVICAPLDLDVSAREIDARARTVYRRYVLGGLKEMYRAMAAHRALPLPVEEALRIDTMRRWDDRIVAPRYGFDGARDYYRRASAGPRMSEVRVPTLFVATRHDPMVLERAVLPSLANVSPRVEVRWLSRGGHVGFTPGVDLGQLGPLGLEAQTVAWLSGHAGEESRPR